MQKIKSMDQLALGPVGHHVPEEKDLKALRKRIFYRALCVSINLLTT
jgi:hypothetical protein